jgi:hypothetical protein
LLSNNPIIRLATPGSNTASEFQNYIDKLTITTLTLTNITHYNPGTATPALLSMSNDIIDDSTISGLNIDGFDLIRGQSIFSITNYANLEVDGTSIKNVNTNAYNYDTDNLNYISTHGAVFNVYTITENTNYAPFEYTFK